MGMLGLCRVLIKHERFARGVMFTLGVIPGLLVVVLWAEKREMGREAARLLRSMRWEDRGNLG